MYSAKGLTACFTEVGAVVVVAEVGLTEIGALIVAGRLEDYVLEVDYIVLGSDNRAYAVEIFTFGLSTLNHVERVAVLTVGASSLPLLTSLRASCAVGSLTVLTVGASCER